LPYLETEGNNFTHQLKQWLMRPIPTITFCFILLLSHYAQAQSLDAKATMTLERLSVHTNGQMLAFNSGLVFQADSFGGDWRVHPQFSNVDCCLAPLWASDSGVAFKKIDLSNLENLSNLEKAGVYFCNAKGQAWATTAKGIFFSANYGGNWRHLNNKVRSEILAGPCFYFKDTLKGIFSGGEWGIFLTEDNCKTFRNLQTPDDQKKKDYRSKIHKVLLYDDWLIVQNWDKWFYSKSDSINWQPLLAIKELRLDTTTNQLWGFNDNNQVVQLNNQLKIKWKSEDAYPLDYPLSIQAQNGHLYVTIGQYLYKINQKETKRVLNYQRDKYIEVDVENRDTTASVVWGWDNANVYQSKNSGLTWRHALELPYPFVYANPYCVDMLDNRRFSAVNDSIISIYEFDKIKRVQFNSQTKALTPHSIQGLFDGFLKAKIKKVVFSDCKSSCFFPSRTFITYNLNKDKTRFRSDYSTSGYGDDLNAWQRFTIPKKYNRRHFNPSKIDTLLNQLNRQPERHLTWSDFNIKKTDKERYLKHLKDLKKSRYSSYAYDNFENPLYYPTMDTLFLKSMALQEAFSDSLLTEIFCYDIPMHGARHYLKIEIENENGETIEISDDLSYRTPPYLLWVVKYKKWEFRTADIRIFKFMSALVPKTFWHYGHRPRWQTYLDIAEYLYPKRVLKD
jgi:hypothetical protein